MKQRYNKKSIIVNIDGNLYHFSSIRSAANYLNLCYSYVWMLLNNYNNKKINESYRIKIEYYNEAKHTNIKEYMD